MVDPHFTCGSCVPCQSDKEHLCEKMGFLGASGGYAGGGLSEFVVVDAEALHRLPDTISVDDAAIIEPLTVAHHAIRVSRAELAADHLSILIVGGGPIGYAMALTLRAHGARLVLLSEPTTVRREFAAEVVDVILDPTSESIGHRCREATGGLGVDLVFDCAGTRRGSEDGFDAIKYGGLWVNVAMWASSVCLLSTLYDIDA
jgi:threonine dehydrogenase-like Zn-dependent dehydrogenase